MTAQAQTRQDPGGKVRVWDPIVRIGHWVIVIGVFTAYFSGDELPTIHVWAGYVVGAAVVIRVLWGLVGGRNARFRYFVKGPRATFAYLKGLVTGKAERSLGHNPAGAAMIVALLLALAGTTGSGMALLAIEEGQGPLASVLGQPADSGRVPEDARVGEEREHGDGHEDSEAGDEHGDGGEELVETLHSAFVYLTLGLAFLHVLGVLASGLAHRENLVAAMITGRKRP